MLPIVMPTIQPTYTILIIVLLYLVSWIVVILHTIYYWTGRRQTTKIRGIIKEKPYITIIIPTRNESIDTLTRLLKALMKQSYPKDKMEIIIVSDDTEEEYNRIREELSKISHESDLKINFHRRENPKGLKAGALNYALNRSKGKYIVVFDADAIPEEKFIEKAITYMEENNLDGLATKWTTLNMHNTPIEEAQKISMEYISSIILKGKKLLKKPIIIPGSGSIFKREALLEVNGWNEEAIAEDIDLSIRLITNGKKLDYMDEAEVKVEVPLNYEDFKKQQTRWIYGTIQALVKNASKILKAKIPLIWKIDIIAHLLQYHAILANFAIAIIALASIIVKTDLISQAMIIMPIVIVTSALEAISYLHTARKMGLNMKKSIIVMGRCTALAISLAPQVMIQTMKIILKHSEKWEVTPKGGKAKTMSGRKAAIIENTITLMGFTAMITLLALGYQTSAIFILTMTIPYAYISWKKVSGDW